MSKRFENTGGFEAGNDNQRENKQFRDLTRHLSKDKKRRVHDVISGRNWTYQKLKEYIETM